MRGWSAIRDALDHADGWLCYFSATAATPLSWTYARDCVRPGTGGSASPPFGGFALVRRCTVSRLHGQSCIGVLPQCLSGVAPMSASRDAAQCLHQETQREREVIESARKSGASLEGSLASATPALFEWSATA